MTTGCQAEKRNCLFVLTEEKLQHQSQSTVRHVTVGHEVSLVPVVTEALASISCISPMKFLSPIQLVPAAIHGSGWPHCYSMQCPCDTAQNPLYDTTQQLTILSSGKASGQCPPRAKQWQCYYPYLQTGESETNGHDRWLCHAQQQGTGDEGIVASCPSAGGYCLPCKGQKKRAKANTPICQSLQLIPWHVY